MLNGPKHNLLLMFLLSDSLSPQFPGTLSLAFIASHEVVSELLVGLVAAHYCLLSKLILLLLGVSL